MVVAAHTETINVFLSIFSCVMLLVIGDLQTAK